MKNILLIIVCFFGGYWCKGQTYVKFSENGLMKDASAFGALLCPLDSAVAAEVFKTATSLEIPRKHINGYCEVRADFLCRKLSPLVYGPGCEIGKIWVFAPSIYTLMLDDKLKADNPLFKGETIKWDYHVAPVLAVRNGNKVDTVVVDFSFKSDWFLHYKDWLKLFNCEQSIYTFTDDSYYLFYTLEGLTLTGSKYNNYTTPSNLPKIITGHFWYLSNQDTTSIASGLAYNDLAVYLVDKYYYDSNFDQFKEVIKSATGLKEMRRLVSGMKMELPPKIVNDCIQFYNSRVEYWKNKIVHNVDKGFVDM